MGLAFGITFEFPLVLVFLSLVRALSSAAMLRAWRPAMAVIIVAAAVITPSQDPISLFAMAVPMWLFYFSAAAIARFIIEPRRPAAGARRHRGALILQTYLPYPDFAASARALDPRRLGGQRVEALQVRAP